MAVETDFAHGESWWASLTLLDSWVPGRRSNTSNTVSKVVKVGSCSWADAAEGSGVIDQMRRAGNAGLDLGVPDSGGSTLDAIT